MIPVVLRRLADLAVSNAFAFLRLLPRNDRDKDVEILALRHQIGILRQQLAGQRPPFQPADRAFLAALLAGRPKGLDQSFGTDACRGHKTSNRWH